MAELEDRDRQGGEEPDQFAALLETIESEMATARASSASSDTQSNAAIVTANTAVSQALQLLQENNATQLQAAKISLLTSIETTKSAINDRLNVARLFTSIATMTNDLALSQSYTARAATLRAEADQMNIRLSSLMAQLDQLLSSSNSALEQISTKLRRINPAHTA